ncbi:hypothetical protein M426DRAFT_323214 [Hypoxylon sp. CI-4A]|nr:hypothetical protein M426DRAFT_323214 [Hypoxylon sp. CI-4A]
MPPFILDLSFSLKGRLGSPWGKIGGNGLKSLWIFLLSAGCHILVNLVVLRINTTRQELRFFLSNFLVCLLETVVQSILLRKLARCAGSNTWLRVLGYAWVFVSFFCTVPAWKYPTVYSALRS